MPPDPRLAAERYRRHAARYDESCARTQPLRREAIDALGLRGGETVLDAGSGTGMSFAWIEEQIGPEGRLVGIELSPDMMRRARDKVDASGYRNVTLIESTVEEAAIPAPLDAVLVFYAHDITRSARALDNVFRHARRGARVVVAGMKLFPWWAFPLNAFALAKAYPYMTTFGGLRRPWDLLARRVPDLRVRSTQLGMGFIAWGHVHG